jgi:hypothetical protein
MPRPGPRKIPITVKLTVGQMAALRRLADERADGNKSEMLRRLIADAAHTNHTGDVS